MPGSRDPRWALCLTAPPLLADGRGVIKAIFSDRCRLWGAAASSFLSFVQRRLALRAPVHPLYLHARVRLPLELMEVKREYTFSICFVARFLVQFGHDADDLRRLFQYRISDNVAPHSGLGHI